MVLRAFRLQYPAGGILGAYVARRQNKVVCWYGKPWPDAYRSMNTDENHPLPHLWNSVPRRVKQRVGNVIALFIKALRHEFRNVGTTMVKDVWHVLHEKCYRLCSPDECDIPFPEADTTVYEEGLVRRHLFT
jgi:hypothetical protein